MGTRAGWDAKLKNAQVYKAERYTPAQKPEKRGRLRKRQRLSAAEKMERAKKQNKSGTKTSKKVEIFQKFLPFSYISKS